MSPIHHQPRHSRRKITARLEAAGLAVKYARFFNALGEPGWWLNAVLLRGQVPGLQTRVADWPVPWLRIERRLRLPFGMSFTAVGQEAH